MKNAGDINQNQQKIIRLTEKAGTDYNSKIWILQCCSCLHIYGANGTDAWERKCPRCQKGKQALEVPAERSGEDWNRAELIIALHFYSGIDFGQIHMGNPTVRLLAALLGRTVGSASYKLANLARHDPELQARNIKGAPRGSKEELGVWRDFASDPEALAFESTRLLAEVSGKSIAQVAEIDERDLPPEGIEREVLVRLRVNQSFFRRRVLSAYCFKCCVTGLTARPLLVASHIVRWADDPKNRLNPKNGLCLNALHDRAFDSGLMWIDSDFKVRFSPKLAEPETASTQTAQWFTSFEGQPLLLPKGFEPDREFLSIHASQRRS